MTVPRRLFLFALLAAALAWIAYLATRPPELGSVVAPAADSTSTGFRSARLYFASSSGDSLIFETREQIETQNFHDRVASLVDELQQGPHARGIRTVPAGTTVLHVYLDDRGLLTLDLSRPFKDAFHGGSTAEFLAVASLTRTLAANLAEVKRVTLVCGGLPLPTLSGHLPLDRPIDVADLP